MSCPFSCLIVTLTIPLIYAYMVSYLSHSELDGKVSDIVLNIRWLFHEITSSFSHLAISPYYKISTWLCIRLPISCWQVGIYLFLAKSQWGHLDMFKIGFSSLFMASTDFGHWTDAHQNIVPVGVVCTL